MLHGLARRLHSVLVVHLCPHLPDLHNAPYFVEFVLQPGSEVLYINWWHTKRRFLHERGDYGVDE